MKYRFNCTMKIWANIPSPAAWRCEIWLMWVLTRGDDECSVVSASCYHVRRNWIWEEPAGRRKLWKETQENNSSASFRCYKITTTLVHPTRPIFVFFFLVVEDIDEWHAGTERVYLGRNFVFLCHILFDALWTRTHNIHAHIDHFQFPIGNNNIHCTFVLRSQIRYAMLSSRTPRHVMDVL